MIIFVGCSLSPWSGLIDFVGDFWDLFIWTMQNHQISFHLSHLHLIGFHLSELHPDLLLLILLLVNICRSLGLSHVALVTSVPVLSKLHLLPVELETILATAD